MDQRIDRSSQPKIPLDRFDYPPQLGGITTAELNDGPGRGSRIAMVNTGAGLRYTVALDRGADIVDAFVNQHALAYLTQNGIKPPDPAYHSEWEWLAGWPGGLVTTCGPVHFGHPRDEPGGRTSLHGRYSSQPAHVEMVVSPEPHRGRHEMLISAVVRDSRAYGPNVEVRRTIQSTLLENRIRLFDQTTNRDNKPVPFGLLYHCNLGWPLLDEGASMVLSGRIERWPDELQEAPVPDDDEGFKRIPRPSKAWAGRSRGFICTPRADRNGVAHIGLVNPKLPMALEVELPVAELPRVMVWQHYAPGFYVLGIEPMAGSPFGQNAEPDHVLSLEPGQMRRTSLTFRVHSDTKAIERFARRDKPLESAR
jgi:hypothetical protein